MPTLPEILSVQRLLSSPQSPIRFEGAYTLEEPFIVGEVPASVAVRISETGFSVEGKASAEIENVCDACLERYTEPLDVEFNEKYVLSSFSCTDSVEHEVRLDSVYEEIDEEGELDLKDMIRQLLIIESTGPHRCKRPDCKPQGIPISHNPGA